ncbi:hypothetical protein BBJ28_00004185 [Nothophytophthora sp. Chile5]|nr:hypothetical protein BBJ28_00004185 [Nothophytophthora sp. Chile5]
MDPATYDEDAYRAELRRKMQASEVIVYQALFAPEHLAPGQPVLVAATSSGMIHIYLLGKVMVRGGIRPLPSAPHPLHTGTKSAVASTCAHLPPIPYVRTNCCFVRTTSSPGPNLSFQAHPTQIYALRFAGDGTNPLLISSGGDQDFRVWSWKDVLAAAESPASAKTLEPVHIAHLERRTLGFRGALLPASEVNDIAVSNAAGHHLFLAGGDSVAQEWDLHTQQFTRQYEGHKEYLHAVRYLQHSQELVTGSEDGTLGIWDVRQDKKVEFLRPQPAVTTSSPSASSQPLWVGAVAHDASEMWLACGGGKRHAPGGRAQHAQASGGFLGMWHLPSRVPVHYTETSSDVHDVAFHHMELLSVGNDASLKKWNRSSGQLLAAAHSTLPSCHFCVVDDATDIIAVGGTAPMIDIYTMPGVVSFSLVVEDAATRCT